MTSFLESKALYNIRKLKKKRKFKHQRDREKAIQVAVDVIRNGIEKTAPVVFDYAKQHRQKPTYMEGKFRRLLRTCRVSSRFESQVALFGFILDFYCPGLQFGIEIDGSSHIGKEEYDKRRENILLMNGIRLLRFTDDQVRNAEREVMKKLLKEIGMSKRIKKLKMRKNRPWATTGKVYLSHEYSQDQLRALIPQ